MGSASRMTLPAPALADRVWIVTGANSGIGKATAWGLARLGGTVVLACRNTERGEAARGEIMRSTGNDKTAVMFRLPHEPGDAVLFEISNALVHCVSPLEAGARMESMMAPSLYVARDGRPRLAAARPGLASRGRARVESRRREPRGASAAGRRATRTRARESQTTKRARCLP